MLEHPSQISAGGSDNRPLAATLIPQAQRTQLPYNHPVLDEFATATEAQYGLPQGLLLAVKNAGERSNTVRNGQLNVSPAGAKGVMQFIDSTRRAYEHDVTDPLESIDAAGRYFSDLLRQYRGNPLAAIAHYNGGTAAGRAVMEGRQPPAQETRDYLQRIQVYLDRMYR